MVRKPALIHDLDVFCCYGVDCKTGYEFLA